MPDTVERNTQVERALAIANVSGNRVSGIFIIWSGWSKVPFMKLGLTTNIYSRAMNGYSHYMPFADPGRSFDLVGYMVVAPSLVRARETRVLNLASKQNGWETPPHDMEWRHWLGASGDVYMAIAKLLDTLRTTVDGLWYTFERGTGKILRQGGSHISLDQALVLPLIPNVLTRSLWGRNVRQAGKVQVIIGSGGGATVAGADNNRTTRRFRDALSPEPLYQLTYSGCNLQCFCVEHWLDLVARSMNHRKRRGGNVTVATICCLCYHEQNRIRAASYRITHDDKIDMCTAFTMLDNASIR
ncbi:hypothetical protein T492DRAFT_834714 [Pavlovales sp. CCMP2436]|nr:hypothetical protein T492DRAFT_834714 [Pavlovales sp. CCMP2436]